MILPSRSWLFVAGHQIERWARRVDELEAAIKDFREWQDDREREWPD